jgi:hypothetical protein
LKPETKSIAVSTVAVLLIATLTVAVFIPNAESEQAFLAQIDESGYWHHDCSNLTDFYMGDDSWPHDPAVAVTFGSISTSGTYFYSNDVGIGTGLQWHGPLLYYALANPLELDAFVELRAEIEMDATVASRRGWVRVGLHAPDNSTVITLQVADPWVASSRAYAQALYKFDNGTLIQTSQSYPDYTNPEPVHESFAIVQNSSGIYTAFPGILNSSVLAASQNEDSRQIKYISIQFNGYETDILCETMRIHDIELSWNAGTDSIQPIIDEPQDIMYEVDTTGHTIKWSPSDANPDAYEILQNDSIVKSGKWNSSGESISISVDGLDPGLYNYSLTVWDITGNMNSDSVLVRVFPTVDTDHWHHDCSNMTAFDGRGDDSWPHNSDVSVAFGTIQTSGSYFYSTDVGTGYGHHGPLYYHTLETPFTIGQFVELQTEIEMDASAADRRGWIRVGLHAPDNATILTIQVADPWTGTSAASVLAVYKFENGTVITTPAIYPAYASAEPNHGIFSLIRNSSGLFSAFPGIRNSSLLESAEMEVERQIKYISIQFNGYDTGILCETMRIHDINLTWNSSVITETPTTTQPTTPSTPTIPSQTNGTWNWEDLPDPVVFLIAGLGGTVLVLVVFVACIRFRERQ